MPQTMTKQSKDIVKRARANVRAIGAEDASGLAGAPDHIFVDLRDGTEQGETRVIPGVGALE